MPKSKLKPLSQKKIADLFKPPQKIETELSFCDKCDKIVPESERYKWCGKIIHYWVTTENAYNNAGTNRIGYFPVQRQHHCGELREPNPQEYFIYETLK
jgi:hypothetical protein